MAAGAYKLRTERFDRLVLEHGYRSRQHFCDEANISRSSLDDMRSGKHEPSLKNVRKIIDGFDRDYPFSKLFEPTSEAEWLGAAA